MPDNEDLAIYRPELGPAIDRGGAAVARLMAASTRALRAGQTVLAMGEPHGTVYRIRSGWLARSRPLPDGRNQILAVMLPGELVGLRSIFTTHQPEAVEALNDAVVEQVDHRRLYEAVRQDQDLALHVMWQLVEYERWLHSWVVSLGQGNADERVAQLIMELRWRLVRAGLLGRDATAYDLPMRQQHMADLLGLTVVHVSRVLGRLREDGIASVRRGRAEILDMAALARLARPMMDVFDRASSEAERHRR